MSRAELGGPVSVSSQPGWALKSADWETDVGGLVGPSRDSGILSWSDEGWSCSGGEVLAG